MFLFKHSGILVFFRLWPNVVVELNDPFNMSRFHNRQPHIKFLNESYMEAGKIMSDHTEKDEDEDSDYGPRRKK